MHVYKCFSSPLEYDNILGSFCFPVLVIVLLFHLLMLCFLLPLAFDYYIYFVIFHNYKNICNHLSLYKRYQTLIYYYFLWLITYETILLSYKSIMALKYIFSGVPIILNSVTSVAHFSFGAVA